MLTLSPAMVHLLQPFADAFTSPTFDHALVLLTGTMLGAGRRTVSAALRAVGLQDERHFTTYHRVLNWATWSPLVLSKILLTLLLTTWVGPEVPLVVAVDDTLERRFGRRVDHKGRYHDAVHSRPGHPITTTGIRWLCCAAILQLPWSSRAWALGCLVSPHHPGALGSRLPGSDPDPRQCCRPGGQQKGGPAADLIPLTVPEARRLLLALGEPPECFGFRLAWSSFRRRHQAEHTLAT